MKSSRTVSHLRRLGTTCLVLAIASALAHLAGLLVVIGTNVLPFWTISGILLIAYLTLLVVAYLAARGSTVPPVARSVLVFRTISISALCLLCLSGAFNDFGASYRVLDPPAANGCRAVVREVSFLFAGSGEVYSAWPFGIASRTGSWTADDGYKPVAHGSYTLNWHGNEGVLHLVGDHDPVWPALQTVRCGLV
ncbi:hypothetical protein [Arthrobacter sp. NPDC090010]|uniref:hypothetical protein n=1 Tax=Arthrobacter sp. NPDC090010 TaxID=3363942 RepID=UPI00381B260C